MSAFVTSFLAERPPRKSQTPRLDRAMDLDGGCVSSTRQRARPLPWEHWGPHKGQEGQGSGGMVGQPPSGALWLLCGE